MNKNMVAFHPVAEVHIDKELLETPKHLKWLKDIPEEGPLCYLVCGGFYTYYLTPQLYQEALQEGLVEQPQSALPIRSYRSMLQQIGMLTNLRINWTLHNTTLEDLRKALRRMNEEPACYEIHIHQGKSDTDSAPNCRLLFDLSAGTVETLSSNGANRCFGRTIDHIALLETLADMLNCQFMSGHHLREEFELGNHAIQHRLSRSDMPDCTVKFLPLL